MADGCSRLELLLLLLMQTTLEACGHPSPPPAQPALADRGALPLRAFAAYTIDYTLLIPLSLADDDAQGGRGLWVQAGEVITHALYRQGLPPELRCPCGEANADACHGAGGDLVLRTFNGATGEPSARPRALDWPGCRCFFGYEDTPPEGRPVAWVPQSFVGGVLHLTAPPHPVACESPEGCSLRDAYYDLLSGEQLTGPRLAEAAPLTPSRCPSEADPCGSPAAFRGLDRWPRRWIATDGSAALAAGRAELVVLEPGRPEPVRRVQLSGEVLGVRFHADARWLRDALERASLSQDRRADRLDLLGAPCASSEMCGPEGVCVSPEGCTSACSTDRECLDRGLCESRCVEGLCRSGEVGVAR